MVKKGSGVEKRKTFSTQWVLKALRELNFTLGNGFVTGIAQLPDGRGAPKAPPPPEGKAVDTLTLIQLEHQERKQSLGDTQLYLDWYVPCTCYPALLLLV